MLDAEATELFAEIVGPNHAVQPGTMRTFLPDYHALLAEHA